MSSTVASYHMTPEFPFFLLPDTPPAEEDHHTAVWSDFTSDAQPSAVQDPSQGDLDVHRAHHFGNASNWGAISSNIDAIDAAAAYAPSPPNHKIYLEDLVDNNFNEANQDPCSLWLAPTPSLTDSNSISSPSGDAPWAEDLASPTYPIPGLYIQEPMLSGSMAAPTFQPELVWPENPDQLSIAPPPFISNSSWDEQTAPEYGVGSSDYTSIGGGVSSAWLPASGCDIFADTGHDRYPSEWLPVQLYRPTFDGAAAEVSAQLTSSPSSMQVVPGTILGKRPCRDEDTYDSGLGVNGDHQQRPCKKGKCKMGMNKVLDSTGTASKARNKPANRTSAKKNDKSKTVGRGAGTLAPTTVQGVYHCSLLGPSNQQVLVGTSAPGHLTWVEERAEGELWHYHSSVVQREVEVQNTEHDGDRKNTNDELFWIPRSLVTRHRALLVAAPTDWQRNAVDELKCRLCPGADFSDWDDYKRHCDTSEAHPAKISYCNHCGDFFARSDALRRHCSKRPAECIYVTAEVAEFKRTETARVFEEFKAELERCLTTDEEVTTSFARTIKDMFPDSSKRGSREQSRKWKSRAGH